MAEVSDSNSRRALYSNGYEINRRFNFPSNYISTTKYNLFTYLPLSLMEQYKRLPNVYFLVIVTIQLVPQVSPYQSYAGVWGVVFILLVSMIREGVEDYLRYKSDKETNSTKTSIYLKGKFQDKTFKDVEVGNIVLVHKDEAFPCDLIMISNSSENGMAFIETSSLDGEKALKPRQAVQATMNENRKEDLIRIFSLIECEHPNARLYQFSGSLEYGGKKHSLDKNNLLLAGAFLKNTEWAIGISVYTGQETKLRQNLMGRRSKQSFIERKLNKYILWILLLQFCFCIIMSFLCAFWTANSMDNHTYLDESEYSGPFQGFLIFFTYYMLLNTMLPLSLIISLEIIKILQGYFMMRDLEMYSSLRDRTCNVSAFSLNEELGMIQHIFSDKTGTLTCNRMQFKLCTVGNKMYGDKQFLMSRQYSSKVTHKTKEIIFTFKTKEIENDLYGKEETKLQFPVNIDMSYGKQALNTQKELLDQFAKCMSLCHECLIEQDKETNELNYIGMSPDEIVLVDAAARIGYKYSKIKSSIIEINKVEFGLDDQCEVLRYEKIATLEFNSDRKRNSVIVKDLQTNRYILYTKGADNVIKARLSSDNNQRYIDKINADLLTYSERGYRTLMFAFKYLEENEYRAWKQRFDVASTSIEGRDQKLDEVAEEIEKDLYLLGCTAVEDSLQEDVPQTIQDFLTAGINVWMLTGDKLETAENIGKTCSLVDDNMFVQRCPGGNLDDSLKLMQLICKNIEAESLNRPTVLIIEGGALEIILFNHKDPVKRVKFPELASSQSTIDKANEMKDLFLKVAMICKTVICCRVTPGEKREVVKLMKEHSGVRTLAVGDGANDVSMILEAHIGVGIYGEEGMQAVQASDYSIGEFRYLWELLFVHGRFNYIRQSEMIMYFFYKNLVFTIPHFYFGFYCAYSGQAFYDELFVTFYNLAFTAWPLIFRALFEKDIEIPKRHQIGQMPPTKLDVIRGIIPKTYVAGRLNLIFTPYNFWSWILSGFVHAAWIFFVPLYASVEGILNAKGLNFDHWGLSVTSISCVIFVVNLKLGLHTRYWCAFNYFGMFFTSFFFYIVFLVAHDPLGTNASAKTVYQLFASQYFYMCIAVSIGFVFVIDFGFVLAKKLYNPSDSDILMKHSVDLRRHQDKD